MNILFLTISPFSGLDAHTIYSDLMAEFVKNRHNVYIVTPVERKKGKPTNEQQGEGYSLLTVCTGNIFSSSLLEKGISTVLLEHQFAKAIRHFWSDVKFDLILYSTPPITFCNLVGKLKRRHQARTYLMLKDIFPQNALDLGMLSTTGWRGFIYRYFRKKEKRLYAVSDTIGCMSPANVRYILEHNPDISPSTVGICPNSLQISDAHHSRNDRKEILAKYQLPDDKVIFIYGGNLGKPQNVPFILDCIEHCQDMSDVFFVIAGSGSDYPLVERLAKENRVDNFRLFHHLPSKEYDALASVCDVGLIFLDYRFTIPNFPSRLLSYMRASLPVLACTDSATDVGEVIRQGNFGWSCHSNDVNSFGACVRQALQAERTTLGRNAYRYFLEHYTTAQAYKCIMQNEA